MASSGNRKSRDPREVPRYGISEAAHYLRVPIATLRSWVVGRNYPTKEGDKFFTPLIELPNSSDSKLSFINLIEAHVLTALRREHHISIPRVRQALNYVKRKLHSIHPLADQQFATDGIDLFIDKYGELINISRDGQLAMRDMLKNYLKRIVRDRRGSPLQLYLYTRKGTADEPQLIVVGPSVSFGRPVLAGTGISTCILAERYKAGESINELSIDYGRSREEIEEAIRCELKAA